jgi:hypothetical protein
MSIFSIPSEGSMSTVKSKKLQVGTDASASNNFTIYQPATPDGTLRIGVGNADSPTEVGRFTSAGYKPATAPTFRVYMSAAQSISHATSTKAQFNTIVWDTTSDFDTTNYRFQPSVAGYYHLCGKAGGQASSGTIRRVLCGLFQNGSEIRLGSDMFCDAGGNITATSGTLSTVVYLNGSTDYVEFYVYMTGGSPSLEEASAHTYFEGYLARAV